MCQCKGCANNTECKRYMCTCLLSMDEDLKCKGVQIEKKRTLSDHRRDDKNNLGVKFSTDSWIIYKCFVKLGENVQLKA